MTVVRAGISYFLVTFAAAFLFGTFRQLVLVPAIGVTYAVLIEMPVILSIAYFVARWINEKFNRATTFLQRLAIGVIGFTCLMFSEAGLSSLFRGWTFDKWLGHFATPDGAISLVMFVLFAFIPVLAGRPPRR